MAYASRGLEGAGAGLGETSVVAVMGLGRIVGLVVIFAENGLGNDIFFGGPVAQIAVAATLAAKREIRVRLGVGRSLANRTAVSHGPFVAADSVPSMADGTSPWSSQKPRRCQYNLAEHAQWRAGSDARQRLRGRHAPRHKQLARRGAGKNFDHAANQVVGVRFGDLHAHHISRRSALSARQLNVRKIKLA